MKRIYNGFKDNIVHVPFLNVNAMIISQFCSRLLGLVPYLRTRSSDHWNRIFGRLGTLIMDGNRRYAKKHNLKEKDGYKVGFLSLMSLLKYCYDLKIKYITIYTFSIDNFRRWPEEVEILMELMQEKNEGLLKEESVVIEYGVKVHFVGNLKLLSESAQSCINRVMKATAHNTKAVLVVCVAPDPDILHAVQESLQHKRRESESEDSIEKSILK